MSHKCTRPHRGIWSTLTCRVWNFVSGIPLWSLEHGRILAPNGPFAKADLSALDGGSATFTADRLSAFSSLILSIRKGWPDPFKVVERALHSVQNPGVNR